MKKYIAIILVAIALPAIATAQNTDKKFSLCVSTGPTLTGYTSTEATAGTFFWNLSVTPDWRFNKHWGLLVDLGAGWGIAGTGAKGGFNTFQAELFLAPYYEWEFEKWYLDVQLGPFARYRDLFFDGSAMFLVGKTLSVGAALGCRAGMPIGERIDVFANLRIEPSLWDPLAKASAKYVTNRIAGNIYLGFGVRFRLSK